MLWRSKHIRLGGLLLGLVSVVFLLWPEMDLWVSQALVDAVTGRFTPKHMQPWYSLYRAVPWVIGMVSLGSVLLWLAGRWQGRVLLGMEGRVVWFLLLGLAIGPGILVNALLKEHWGRARPSQIVEFGGHAHFSAPWVMAQECAGNCSFASGHAAGAFFLLGLGFAFRKRWLYALGVGWGMLIGYVRMVQGGHFFSDVLIAGLLVYLVFACLSEWLLRAER